MTAYKILRHYRTDLTYVYHVDAANEDEALARLDRDDPQPVTFHDGYNMDLVGTDIELLDPELDYLGDTT